MYCSLFGPCRFPRSGICNSSPRPLNQQKNNTGQSTLPEAGRRPHSDAEKRCMEKCCKDCLIMKHAALGGFVLPDGTEKGATFHVASLNLDTSNYTNFLVQLNFSCNMIASNLKIRLRFQVIKQEKGQCFSVPVSAGILYLRDRKSSEADSFIMSVCDYDSTISTCRNYGVYVEIEDFEPGGTMILANPNLIATIANTL